MVCLLGVVRGVKNFFVAVHRKWEWGAANFVTILKQVKSLRKSANVGGITLQWICFYFFFCVCVFMGRGCAVSYPISKKTCHFFFPLKTFEKQQSDHRGSSLPVQRQNQHWSDGSRKRGRRNGWVKRILYVFNKKSNKVFLGGRGLLWLLLNFIFLSKWIKFNLSPLVCGVQQKGTGSENTDC